MTILVELFNVVLAAFIVSTMLAAGLGISLTTLFQTCRNFRLLVLVLLVNLVLIPLVGWGIAALLALAPPAYIALVLFASSPGAPVSVKLAMLQWGDTVAGTAMQLLLALIGSLTFTITAGVILPAANIRGAATVSIGDLVKTITAVQLVPFAFGLLLRRWAPRLASKWRPVALMSSNVAFVLVLADALIAAWRDVVGTIGSLVLLAALLFTVTAMAMGWLLSTGSPQTRTTMATLAPARSSGPVFAAIAIGFGDNLAILGAASSIAVVILFITVMAAWCLAWQRGRAVSNGASASCEGEPGVSHVQTHTVV